MSPGNTVPSVQPLERVGHAAGFCPEPAAYRQPLRGTEPGGRPAPAGYSSAGTGR
jgi:hypothetical protein